MWPVWVLVAATVFLGGFRIGLNVRASNVIDVGYAGVIGADRIWHGESPYDHFPVEEDRRKCGPADAAGEVRERVQTNGRCESANGRGDTYGPVSYLAYLPGYLAFGWSGKWDTLPAAHATSILWDLLCLLGLALVGRRLGGPRDGSRLAATLAFAWVAWPFTQYASNSNTNDLIQPALLVWGFYFASSPVARGAFPALGSWTKFAPLLLVPLWSGYPETARPRPRTLFLLGFALATVLAFFVLFFEPSPLHAARVFYERTVGWQIDRDSPFSLWDWGQYHARGLPDLHLVQFALQVLLLVGALALWRWPRRRSALQLAAFTAVAADRVRARADALVLPLPAVVLPLRRDRAAVAARRGGAGRGVRPMSALSRFSSRPDARPPCFSRRPLRLRRLVGARAHELLHRAPARRHADLRGLRAGDPGRRGPVPRLRLRVPAGRAAGVRGAGRSCSTTTPPSAC